MKMPSSLTGFEYDKYMILEVYLTFGAWQILSSECRTVLSSLWHRRQIPAVFADVPLLQSRVAGVILFHSSPFFLWCHAGLACT